MDPATIADTFLRLTIDGKRPRRKDLSAALGVDRSELQQYVYRHNAEILAEILGSPIVEAREAIDGFEMSHGRKPTAAELGDILEVAPEYAAQLARQSTEADRDEGGPLSPRNPVDELHQYIAEYEVANYGEIPSRPLMAHALGVSLRAIDKYLRKLKDSGRIPEDLMRPAPIRQDDPLTDEELFLIREWWAIWDAPIKGPPKVETIAGMAERYGMTRYAVNKIALALETKRYIDIERKRRFIPGAYRPSRGGWVRLLRHPDQPERAERPSNY